MDSFTTTTTANNNNSTVDGGMASSSMIHNNNNNNESTAHSPFLSNLLRFSPKNSNNGSATTPHHHLSPMFSRGGRDSVTNAGQQQQRRTRFFETSTRTHASLSQESEQMDDVHDDDDDDHRNHHEEEQNKTPLTATPHDSGGSAAVLLVDGIPIDPLRAVAHQSLETGPPPTAVFYSGLLYAKTDAPADALLLARAHLAAGHGEACLRILEDAALLQQSTYSTPTTTTPESLLTTLPWDAALVAAQALSARKDWSALTELLEEMCRYPEEPSLANDDGTGAPVPSFHSLAASQPLEDDDILGWNALKRSIQCQPRTSPMHPLALLCWYRGLAYHETGCGLRATTFWKLALRLDCQCRQAWESLLEKNLLTAQEGYYLIVRELEFGKHQDWLRSLYLARIEMTPQEPTAVSADSTAEDGDGRHAPRGFSVLHGTSLLDDSSIQLSSPIPTFQIPGGLHTSLAPETTTNAHTTSIPPIQRDVDAAFDDLWNKHKLHDSPQVLAMAARRSYRRYDWKAALSYCEDLVQLDPSVEEAAFCYISTLVILGHKRVLFRLAHEWVEAAPKSAQSWFAVGAYYYCIQRYHIAQRHFCRATRLDPKCTEAWIAFGCSFAACDESDQALASFRAAQRLSPGEHSSLMYMGMEYVRTNHLVLASFFLQAALKASGGDPLCLHELGVLAAQRNEHEEAISWFRRALASAVGGDTLEESLFLSHDSYWEPTIFNLGHSYRKSRHFEQAVCCFSRCVALCPDRFSTYTALAFTKQLMGDLNTAISLYHQALGLKPDDPFSTDMLNHAFKDQIASTSHTTFDLPTTFLSRKRQTDPSPMLTDDSKMSLDNSTSSSINVTN